MDYVVVRRGAKLKRVIVDRYNEIPENARIGFDPAADLARYKVTDSGIVVIPEGQPFQTARTSFSGEL
jgi:glucose-1-phosphate adenylyltransferase